MILLRIRLAPCNPFAGGNLQLCEGAPLEQHVAGCSSALLGGALFLVCLAGLTVGEMGAPLAGTWWWMRLCLREVEV